jgi:uncharacterized protein (TIGR00369 family)
MDAGMTQPNTLAHAVGKVAGFPPALRGHLITLLFTSQVKFAGTAGVRFIELQEGRAVLGLKNRRKVRNHIGGVHAAATALLAETATGAVFGMTLPDTHIPLLKRMKIDYVRRANGDLRAEAALSPEQRQQLLSQDKGELTVPVRVTDAAGEETVQCEMVWAWIPRKKPGA